MLLVSTTLVAGSYGLLLPVVPLWAVSGGAGPAGAGAANAVLFAAGILTQLCTPYVLRLLGHRETLVVGAALLGLPVFGYQLTAALPAVIAFSALRGFGFGLVIGTGGAFVPRLLPADRRGRGLGLYGLATGVPNLLLRPAGPSLSGHVGFGWLFLAGGVLPLAAAAIAAPMRIRTRRALKTAWRARTATAGHGAGRPDLSAFVLPITIMGAAALGASAYVTFLPTAIHDPTATALGLLAQAAGVLAGRWSTGVLSDRRRGPVLVLPAVLACSAGLALTAASAAADPSWLVIGTGVAGGLWFGLGFGAIQTATLKAMFDSVSPHGYDVASSAWNVAFDAGLAVGSTSMGVAAEAAGFPLTFATAALLLAGTSPAAVGVARAEERRPTCHVRRVVRSS